MKSYIRDFPPGFDPTPTSNPSRTLNKNRDFQDSCGSSAEASGSKKREVGFDEKPETNFEWRRNVSATRTKPKENDNMQALKKKKNKEEEEIVTANGNNNGGGKREELMTMLEVFRKKCRELSRLSIQESGIHRYDLRAKKDLTREGKITLPKQCVIGHVPGVVIGDRFEYRVELIIAGLHSKLQHGIDYKEVGGNVVATCIVATDGYADKVDDNSETIRYVGEGGGEWPKDQVLKRGNLALKNSMVAKNYVRVVRGIGGCSRVRKTVYVYDGLYRVTSYEVKSGPTKTRVFEFTLTRCPGQPRVDWHYKF